MSGHGIRHRPASMVVAIDFGTHGTGFGYSIAGNPIRLHIAYTDAPRRSPKTLSAILYKNSEPISFGYAAKKQFKIKRREEEAITTAAGGIGGSTSAASSSPWHYIQSFKLLLLDPAVRTEGLSKLVTRTEGMLPPGINKVQVIADFFSLFKRYILSTLREQLVTGPGRQHLISSDCIIWVVTVPVKWTEAAKSDMREACIRAGLIAREKPERMIIALEPESAALCVMKGGVSSAAGEVASATGEAAFAPGAIAFATGEVIMVLDAGGGTVDWTIHNCIERSGQKLLAEATASEGEPLGSLLLDSAFMDLFKEVVGVTAYESWRQCHPIEVLTVQNQWENIKCNFGAETDAAKTYGADTDGDNDGSDDGPRISIPPALHAIMTIEDKQALRVEYGGDDSITLSRNIMMELFDPTINKIVEQTNKQLGLVRTRVDKVILVGGVCSSLYAQKRIKEEVKGHGLPPAIIVAPHPDAAVLQGAVVFGSEPELIHARRARYTYGVKTCGLYVDGAPERVWHPEEQAFYTEALFTSFVVQGEKVECKQTVEHFFNPMSKHQTQCNVQIYMMDGPAKRFVDEADVTTRELALLTVMLDGATDDSEERLIKVSFQFGRTEITASAIDETTQMSCKTVIKFASS